VSATGRDFAKGTIVTLVPTAFGFVLSGPIVGAICLFVAFALSLILWTPLGPWLGFHPPANTEAEHDPSRRKELCEWLGKQIEQLHFWQTYLNEEAVHATSDFERTRNVELRFWNGWHAEVADRLRMHESSLADSWEKSPDWFSAIPTNTTLERTKEFARFLGWSAEQLRRIKEQLRA
jgi:hypothetical protein